MLVNSLYNVFASAIEEAALLHDLLEVRLQVRRLASSCRCQAQLRVCRAAPWSLIIHHEGERGGSTLPKHGTIHPLLLRIILLCSQKRYADIRMGEGSCIVCLRFRCTTYQTSRDTN